MQLYNSRTKKVELLKSYDSSKVRMYSCGPTVYEYVHIGNLRAFVAADTLKRALLASGYEVTHVMNITDVDDKTIKRALEDASVEDPIAALKEVTTKYEAAFMSDIAAVHNLIEGMTFVRATDSITGIKTLISLLHDEGFAYTTKGGVYFSIEAYKKSGKHYGQLIDLPSQDTSKARIDNDEYDKKSVHDFALWKVAKPNEPSWSFELDRLKLDGRPGWHIECSVMSSMKLGQPFDIHTGGIDLLFPHHENEIAQSTAGKSNKTYANFFVHSEHLLVKGKKMSKSLNNFYTLNSITEKSYSPLDLRLLFLQSHYRHQTDFSFDSLQAAANRLQSWRSTAALIHQPIETKQSFEKQFKQFSKDVIEHISNDVDTPNVLVEIDQLFSRVADGLSAKDIILFKDALDLIDKLLGLNLSLIIDIPESAKTLLNNRTTARGNKDWAGADSIRDELRKQHVQIRDTPNGQIWSWLRR